jgi:hypothetical protein
MTAPETTIIIDKGSVFELGVMDRDNAGEPVDYSSGYTARLAIKKHRESADFIYESNPLVNAGHITLSDGTDPEAPFNISIVIPGTVTDGFPVLSGAYFWLSIETTNNPGSRQMLVVGQVKIRDSGIE